MWGKTQLTGTASTQRPRTPPFKHQLRGAVQLCNTPWSLTTATKARSQGLEVLKASGLIRSWLPHSLPPPTCLTRYSIASPGKLAMMPRASMIDVSCSSRSNMAKIVLLSSWPCPSLAHRHAEGGGICDHSSHKPPLPTSVLS